MWCVKRKVKRIDLVACCDSWESEHQNQFPSILQAIQFSISTKFSSIRPIDRTLSGATTLGWSGPGSNGNKGVLRIPQSSYIIETSQSDCLVSYPGHSFWGQGILMPLQRSIWCILQSQLTGQIKI